MLRLKVIACKVLSRELGFLSASCPNFLDITWMRQGFHDEPDRLRAMLQSEIDKIDAGIDEHTCADTPGDFDAIVLGYGLCSSGIEGVRSKKYPIVVPRAHDCITLFLGSKERYRELFDSFGGGVYWYTPGWIENSLMPSKERKEKQLKEYIERYGEDNAEYLMEMESGWLRDYKAAAYIDMPIEGLPDYSGYTKSCADYLGWSFHRMDGGTSLLKELVAGNWDDEKFLIIPPGKTCRKSYKDDIIRIGE